MSVVSTTRRSSLAKFDLKNIRKLVPWDMLSQADELYLCFEKASQKVLVLKLGCVRVLHGITHQIVSTFYNSCCFWTVEK